jgi:hypothetical protein
MIALDRSPQSDPGPLKISPSAIELPPTRSLDITAWMVVQP